MSATLGMMVKELYPDLNIHVAVTHMDIGTDVNFGALTRRLLTELDTLKGYQLFLNHEIKGLKQDDQEFHSAKVYGKASVGSPPMSVPHLDTRTINGKKALLFGPFADFSTKFLKNGLFLDLPLSIKTNNILPMLSAGLDNIAFTKYLISQASQSPEDRLKALKEYYPDAQMQDWVLEMAGQRVQVIKKDSEKCGILEFGTEVVISEDKTIAALLGASPGASTSVSIMLELLERCLGLKSISPQRQEKLQQMIPTYCKSLALNAELCEQTRLRTSKILSLTLTVNRITLPRPHNQPLTIDFTLS